LKKRAAGKADGESPTKKGKPANSKVGKDGKTVKVFENDEEIPDPKETKVKKEEKVED
jgi:hypothetical protein